MTVALMGYLKSHPATKQEAQLQKVEQSALVKEYPKNHFCKYLYIGPYLFVYLGMLFIYEKIYTPNCRVAKYIRFPKIAIRNINSPLLHDIQKTYNLIIHKTYNRYHATLYHTKNNVVYFYKTHATTLRDIIVLYNHRNNQTYFMQLGFYYDSKNAAKYKYTCVKAPNGNLYLVYVRWMSGTKKKISSLQYYE
jgi:hypothetical protein